jgi:hypothetical protein
LDRVMAWLARRWPKLFAYQILVECTRTDSPQDLMRQIFSRELTGSTESESVPLARRSVGSRAHHYQAVGVNPPSDPTAGSKGRLRE